MNNRLTLFGFFISLFLFINSVLALPCAFFGKVTLDGSPVSGTYVEAYYLNETFIAKGKEPSAGFGYYSIAVNTPGENITLKIKGIPVDQGSQLCKNGESNYLNITATTPPTTTTIPVTTTVSSGNGGGGGGGGGSITTTVPVTTTVTDTEEGQGETSMQSSEVNAETTLPSQTETTTTPSNTVRITGSFLKMIYSLGYWWILIIIIVLLVIIILSKYYEIEFK